MNRREFVRINTKTPKGRLKWHVLSKDQNFLLCREQYNIGEFNGRVLAVTYRQEHKPPRPLCKTCAERIAPGYTNKWVEVIRFYPHN